MNNKTTQYINPIVHTRPLGRVYAVIEETLMSTINLTLTNVLYKDGMKFDPMVEVITTSSRLIKRIVQCELEFGAQVNFFKGEDKVELHTQVMGNHDVITLTPNEGGHESFARLVFFLECYHELKRKPDQRGTTVVFAGKEVNLNVDLDGKTAPKAAAAALTHVGVRVLTPYKDELYALLGLWLEGNRVEDINYISK